MQAGCSVLFEWTIEEILGNVHVHAAENRTDSGAVLQVEPAAHAALMKALWADTAFLAGQGVMDYSLLVGVDSPNGALVVGIIDFLRQVRTALQICAASMQSRDPGSLIYSSLPFTT